MTDPFRELLSGLSSKMSGANLAEQRDRVLEEEIVKVVLRKLKLESYKRALSDHSNTHFGTRYLRFEGFHDRFPSFPIRLVFRSIKGLVAKVNRLSLFNNFVNLPFMPAYSEILADWGEDHAVGLVMPWGHMAGGMVLHNCQLDLDNNGTRLAWIYRNKQAKVTQRLVLEPMGSLLRSVAAWSPDE